MFIEDTANHRALFYAPGRGEFEPHLRAYTEKARCLLVDGTAWTDDELAHCGVGTKRVSEMGHLALSGAGGMIDHLRPFDARKILIHINNTNPILDDHSPEGALLAAEGSRSL